MEGKHQNKTQIKVGKLELYLKESMGTPRDERALVEIEALSLED